jgi:site-specific DNA-methyltransferase (adenine-specific)
MEYDASKDAIGSYYAAVEAKRVRGDTTDWERPWKRFEQIGQCSLYLGDCREILPYIEGVNALVSDPPYGISYKSPSGRGETVRGDYPIIHGDDQPFDPTPFLGYSQVVLFGANHYADKLPPSAKWLVWDKRDGGTPNNNSDCELAWVKNGGSARLIRHLWNGMLKASEKDDRRVHPTQKPVAVMEWVLKQATKEGDLVLDPFLGSGSTGIACLKLGRRFVGIEIEPTYFDAACARLRDAYNRPDMFIETARVPEPTQEALSL